MSYVTRHTSQVMPADDMFVASAVWTHVFSNSSDAGQVREYDDSGGGGDDDDDADDADDDANDDVAADDGAADAEDAADDDEAADGDDAMAQIWNNTLDCAHFLSPTPAAALPRASVRLLQRWRRIRDAQCEHGGQSHV